MADSLPARLSCPPFPLLEWNGFGWEGLVQLHGWAGFQSRRPDGAVESDEPSDGTVLLMVHSDEHQTPPSHAQVEAYRLLTETNALIARNFLDRLFAEYPEIRRITPLEVIGWEPDEIAKRLPLISRPDELKSLVGLCYVILHSVSSAGIAYVGFELACTWEIEHGIGFMMHKGRFVEFGHADVAINEWHAERDAEQCNS